ncbi:MAG TPA: TCR/Tet family MFS transporter [Caulobacteraceae bacterium]|nr:TCR/Tet family MFS transporter [Caulobacteraceae bacterium]
MSGKAMASVRPQGQGRTAAFGFIYATAVMNNLSFGLMIPILPNLIRSFFGAATAEATASAAHWQFIFGVTWGLMQFVCGPILGMLSDRFGRRPVLLISIFGLAVDFLIMAFAPTLWWLLIGRILNGATAASFATGNAYVADISPPELRARNFGWMSSAFSIGFLGGPALGGVLAAHDWQLGAFHVAGLRAPFIVAAALCAVNWIYGLLVLPESLPPERRATRFEWRRANPIASLSLLRSHHELLPLAGVTFLFQLAQQVLPNIFVLYTTMRYQWSIQFLGVTFFITGALGILVQSFVVGPVVARVGERGAVLLGAACGAAGYLIYALAPTDTVYFVGMPVFALSGLMLPGLQGLMSRRVSHSEQGRLQGANQSMGGIASILGPTIFPNTLEWALRNVPSLPGLPILIAASLLMVAFFAGLRFAAATPASLEQPAE